MAARSKLLPIALLAGVVVLGVGGYLWWKSATADPELPALLLRLPDRDAVTIHINLAAIRATGLAGAFSGAPVTEERDYIDFVTETGFDWKADLDAVTAARTPDGWYGFARGRFRMDKLKAYAEKRGGRCHNGVCEMAGSSEGRRIGFYPISARTLAIASTAQAGAIYQLQSEQSPAWPGGVPDGPVWVSVRGQALAGDPQLPAGGRLFGKILAETERTTFTLDGGLEGLAIRMRADTPDGAAAERIRAQLAGVTAEFKGYFDRLGQKANPDDLSGVLLSGEFAVEGTHVNGKWPLRLEFLKKLASGDI